MLDGERPDGSDRVTERQAGEHLATCAVCQRWYETAVGVTRAARLQAAEEVPDLTEPILTAVNADPAVRAAARRAVRPDPVTAGRRRILRVAVAVAAVAQLLLAVPALLESVGGGPHASREMASFDVAVAVGFLLAARYPERARAFVPVAVVLALCLAVTSGLDVVNSTTTVADETGHLVAVFQAGLLWALGRSQEAGRRARTVIS